MVKGRVEGARIVDKHTATAVSDHLSMHENATLFQNKLGFLILIYLRYQLEKIEAR